MVKVITRQKQLATAHPCLSCESALPWIQRTDWWVAVVVQLLGCVELFATPWTPARQAPLSSTVSWSLLDSRPLSW